jgi:amino acid permease
VRNVVDSRRNVGSLFLLIAALAVVSFFVRNAYVQTYTSLLLMVFFLFFIVDSFLLSRKIKKAITEKLPKENPKGAVWYGVSRSTMIRRWRFPKPEAPQA